MDILRIAALILVSVGALFMAVAIISSFKTKREVPKSLAGKWLTLSTLMIFFLLGYILFMIIQIYDIQFPIGFFVSIIFMTGGLFVFMVINLSELTISELNIKSRELADINEHLDGLVKQKTNELRRSMETLEEEVIIRKEAEKKIKLAHLELDLIFNTVTEGMRVVDKDFVVIKANKSFEKLISLNQDKIIGKKCYDIFPGKACHTAACPLTMIMLGENHVDAEVEKINPDGSGVFCILTASPHKSAEGDLLGIIETFKDITARKDMERKLVASLDKAHVLTEELEEKQKELSLKNWQLEKAFADLKNTQALLLRHEKMASIGTLAGGIAHEFNNILGAILGYTDMARDESPVGSRTRADLEEVIKASKRAKELVKDILSFSRQREEELSPIQISRVVREAIKLLRSSTPPSVEIRQNICSDCKDVLANYTMIHQLFVNLYTNAVHAMGGKGVIEVNIQEMVHTGEDTTVLPTLLPGEYVRLAVSDNGPGIDLAIKERIFDPFFTTKEVGHGTGMGLSVAHGIVDKLGGLITVDSEPGQGASFHVYIPTTNEKQEVEGG